MWRLRLSSQPIQRRSSLSSSRSTASRDGCRWLRNLESPSTAIPSNLSVRAKQIVTIGVGGSGEQLESNRRRAGVQRKESKTGKFGCSWMVLTAGTFRIAFPTTAVSPSTTSTPHFPYFTHSLLKNIFLQRSSHSLSTCWTHLLWLPTRRSQPHHDSQMQHPYRD